MTEYNMRALSPVPRPTRACVVSRGAGIVLWRWIARWGVLNFEPQEKKLSCQKRNFRISVILIKTLYISYMKFCCVEKTRFHVMYSCYFC